MDADLARFESDLKEQHAKEAGFSDYESKIFVVFCSFDWVYFEWLSLSQYDFLC